MTPAVSPPRAAVEGVVKATFSSAAISARNWDSRQMARPIRIDPMWVNVQDCDTAKGLDVLKLVPPYIHPLVGPRRPSEVAAAG